MTKEGIFKTSMNKIFKLTGSMILLFKTPHIDTYKQTGDNLI
jgi:hypothetical protein